MEALDSGTLTPLSKKNYKPAMFGLYVKFRYSKRVTIFESILHFDFTILLRESCHFKRPLNVETCVENESLFFN